MACHACGTRRQVIATQAAQAAGGDRWECALLFPGASCALLPKGPAPQKQAKPQRQGERQRQAAHLAVQQVRQQQRVQHNHARKYRAEQRAASVSASERYSACAGTVLAAAQQVLHIDPRLLKGLDDEDNDPRYVPQKSKNYAPRRRSTGTKRARGGDATSPPGVATEPALDRDIWEECRCGEWVNLGRPQQGPAGQLTVSDGRCPQCRRDVQWRGAGALQTWIQCDDCGRWRSGLDEDMFRRVGAMV